MNHSGDAAEQIVRMSLEGVEVAARITGSAAKEIALLLIAALKNNGKNSLKLKGKARLTSMLKSGKPLEIFSLKERDLANFARGARQYGIVYAVLRNTKNSPDGLCDVMVKADDAPKISRLVERFKFATVDKAKIESEIVAERAAKTPETEKSPEAKTGTAPAADDAPKSATAGPEAPEVSDTEKLLDELLGTKEGKAAPVKPEPKKSGPEKPAPVKAEPVKAGKEAQDSRPLSSSPEPEGTSPSEPTSGSEKKPERPISSKPSVKEEMREIAATRAGLAARKAKEPDAPTRDERPAADKSKTAPAATTHKQPQRGKPKTKKTKGAR